MRKNLPIVGALLMLAAPAFLAAADNKPTAKQIAQAEERQKIAKYLYGQKIEALEKAIKEDQFDSPKEREVCAVELRKLKAQTSHALPIPDLYVGGKMVSGSIGYLGGFFEGEPVIHSYKVLAVVNEKELLVQPWVYEDKFTIPPTGRPADFVFMIRNVDTRNLAEGSTLPYDQAERYAASYRPKKQGRTDALGHKRTEFVVPAKDAEKYRTLCAARDALLVYEVTGTAKYYTAGNVSHTVFVLEPFHPPEKNVKPNPGAAGQPKAAK